VLRRTWCCSHVRTDAAVEHDLRPLAAADVFERREAKLAERSLVDLVLIANVAAS